MKIYGKAFKRRSPLIVILSEVWLARCRKWADDLVTYYEEQRRLGHPDSNVELGIEKDPVRLAQSKAAEVAFALWLKLDPDQAVNWTLRPDAGNDLRKNHLRFDVKSCEMDKRYLIWPRLKVHKYDAAQFDLLVLVKHAVPVFLIHAYTSKAYFKQFKLVAGPHDILLPGTWFMHEEDLWDHRDLLDLLHSMEGQNAST